MAHFRIILYGVLEICSTLIMEYGCAQRLAVVDLTSCLFDYQLKAALWEGQSVQKR